MHKNTGQQVVPLNWQSLVAEAIRRRKAEKLTQRDHAALASVSVPTLIAFERGERTLTLAKVFDILRVVGLVEEATQEGPQEIFVRDAYVSWRKLTAKLPPDSPGRFPDGSYRIDYSVSGSVKDLQLSQLKAILQQTELRNTGWPMFWSPKRPESSPRETDGVLECWLSPIRTDGHFRDAAHCDFWRAATSGRMFLLRGYQEDSDETLPKRTLFDPTLAIWRLSEGLLHASKLAHHLASDEAIAGTMEVRFRALYTGLTGRNLSTRANPTAPLLDEGNRAQGDEAILELTVPVAKIEQNLSDCVATLTGTLFRRFDVVHTPNHFVANEVARFVKSRV